MVDFFATGSTLEVFADCFIELAVVREEVLRIVAGRVAEDSCDDGRDDDERVEETLNSCKHARSCDFHIFDR